MPHIVHQEQQRQFEMPLIWLSLTFICGIICGAALDLSARGWTILACLYLLTAFLVVYLSRSKRILYKRLPRLQFFHVIVPLLVFLGAIRYQVSQSIIDSGNIAWYCDSDEEYIIEGEIFKPSDVYDNYTNIWIKTDQIRTAHTLLFTPVEGRLLVQVPSDKSWRYGDRIRLSGRLKSLHDIGDLSYQGYLSRKGVNAYMPNQGAKLLQHNQGNPVMALIYGLRQHALDTVFKMFPDPEASLLAGILLGVETRIPEDVMRSFEETGTSHVIVISGFNITIIAGLFGRVFGRLLSRYRGAVAAFLAISIYTILVGADAAVVRAAIMGGLSLFASQVGRRQHGITSLTFVAAVMALINPYILWDVGFQLSFAATLGLILYADPLSGLFIRFACRYLPEERVERLAGYIGEYLLFTFAAQVTTLPIIVYHFGRFSLVSLLANPVILPAQPAVMIFGGLAVMAGLVYYPFGQLLAYLTWPFVVFTIRAVEMFAKISGGVFYTGKGSILVVTMFYCFLFGLTIYYKKIVQWIGEQLKGRTRKVLAILTVILCIATVVVWRLAFTAPDGNLHVTVLDVSISSRSGDAVLIQTPDGRNLLINGGPSSRALSDSLGRRLSLIRRRLDFLIIASSAEDQVAGVVDQLQRFPPENVLWAGSTHGNRSARALQTKFKENGTIVIKARTGQTLNLGGGAELHVLAVNRRGTVLLLEWKNFRALFPLGMDFDTLETLQKDSRLTSVTALMLAENGYAPVNTEEWIEKLNPNVVLLSVSAGDWQGLPSPETLEAVQGYTLLRTDLNGWIHLSTDGSDMWVEVEK